jgi:hypothetical protein
VDKKAESARVPEPPGEASKDMTTAYLCGVTGSISDSIDFSRDEASFRSRWQAVSGVELKPARVVQ